MESFKECLAEGMVDFFKNLLEGKNEPVGFETEDLTVVIAPKGYKVHAIPDHLVVKVWPKELTSTAKRLTP